MTMKKWLWMATAGAAGLLLPEVSSAQGLEAVSPNATGMYAGPNYRPYRNYGYGADNYRGRGRLLRGRGMLRGRRYMEPVTGTYASGPAAAPGTSYYYEPGMSYNEPGTGYYEPGTRRRLVGGRGILRGRRYAEPMTGTYAYAGAPGTSYYNEPGTRGRLVGGRGILRGRGYTEPATDTYAYTSNAAPGVSYYYNPDTQLNVGSAMPAYVGIRVPANAEILFDGEKTSQTGPIRTFVSPALEPGKTFTYKIQARWPGTGADSKPIEQTREVKVQAGQRVLINFLAGDQGVSRYYEPLRRMPSASVPNAAYIDIRVPANAEILFDGEKTSQTGANRTFVSPALEPGKTFTYTIMARFAGPDGKQIERTRTVKVEAGRRAQVDFLNPNQ